MSVFVTQASGTIVLRARSAVHDDPFAQVTSVLTTLARQGERIVLDLDGVTLTPSRRVLDFIAELTEVCRASGAQVVVVADRLSARRLLHALAPGHAIEVVHSVEAALARTGPRVPQQR